MNSLTPLGAAKDQADLIAKYRIEVLFGRNRTPGGPNVAILTFWKKGSRLRGGGDEKIYLCDRVNAAALKNVDFVVGVPEEQVGCGKPIPPEGMTGAMAFCPHCKLQWPPPLLTGELFYKVTTSRLAEVVAKYWRDFEGDADLYMKYHTTDIRYQAMVMEHGAQAAYEHRGLLVYPLSKILRDTAAGAELSGRFQSCLSA
jgi:hypothetical protein